MSEDFNIWNSRWDNQFKPVNSFEEYHANMGIVVKDLLKNLKKNN